MSTRLTRRIDQALVDGAWEVVRNLVAPKTLVEIAGGTVEVPNDPKIRLEAAKLVLAYGHGLPNQPFSVEDLRDASRAAARRLGLDDADADEILALAQQLTKAA